MLDNMDAISSVVSIFILLCCLPGGIVYLFYKPSGAIGHVRMRSTLAITAIPSQLAAGSAINCSSVGRVVVPPGTAAGAVHSPRPLSSRREEVLPLPLSHALPLCQ